MNTITYLKYFWYLGINWGWKLAAYISFHEIRGEHRYGIRTTGADELKTLAKKGTDISDSTIYMPMAYPLLEKIFNVIPASGRNHLADIGSGMGRVLCVAAHHGYHKLTGVDFSDSFCEIAQKNLERTSTQIPGLEYRLYTQDAAGFAIPPDTDCLVFFNPFNEKTMKVVAVNIMKSLREHPRKLYIVYANPLLIEIFTSKGFREIYHTSHQHYLEAVILEWQTGEQH